MSRRIDVVEENASRSRLIEPRNEIDQRALPCAAWADQRDHRSFWRSEAHVAQHGLVIVREAHCIELDRPLEGRDGARSAIVLSFRGLVDDGEQALGRGHRLLRRCRRLRDLFERREQPRGTRIMKVMSVAPSIAGFGLSTSFAPTHNTKTAIVVPMISVIGCESSDTRVILTMPLEYRSLASPNRLSSYGSPRKDFTSRTPLTTS